MDLIKAIGLLTLYEVIPILVVLFVTVYFIRGNGRTWYSRTKKAKVPD